jgi:hypothetical protein
MYGQYKALTGTKKVTFEDSNDEDDESSNSKTGRDKTSGDSEIIIVEAEDDTTAESKEDSTDGNETDNPETPPEPLNLCLACEMKKLGGWFNPAAMRMATHTSRAVEQPSPSVKHRWLPRAIRKGQQTRVSISID